MLAKFRPYPIFLLLKIHNLKAINVIGILCNGYSNSFSPPCIVYFLKFDNFYLQTYSYYQLCVSSECFVIFLNRFSSNLSCDDFVIGEMWKNVVNLIFFSNCLFKQNRPLRKWAKYYYIYIWNIKIRFDKWFEHLFKHRLMDSREVLNNFYDVINCSFF